MAREKAKKNKKLSVIGAVVLVLVALLIVGTAVGFTLGKKNNYEDKKSAVIERDLATRSSPGNVSKDSKIAATIGFDSRVIFYQEKGNHLMMARMDQGDNKPHNMQDLVTGLKFEALPGTAIAAVGREVGGKEEVNLFFYTKAPALWHLVTKGSLNEWGKGSFGAMDPTFPDPSIVSQDLSVMNFPDYRVADSNELQYMVLALRYRDGRLQYRNETDPKKPLWIPSYLQSDGYTEHNSEGESEPDKGDIHIYPNTPFAVLPGTMNYADSDAVTFGIKFLFDGGRELHEFLNMDGSKPDWRKINGVPMYKLPDWMKVDDQQRYAYRRVPIEPSSKLTTLIDARTDVQPGGDQWAYSVLVASPEGMLFEYVWTKWGFWAPGNKTKFLGLDDRNDDERDVKLSSLATTDDGFLFGVAGNGHVYAFDRKTRRSEDIPAPHVKNPGGLSRGELEKAREWTFVKFVDED